MPFGMYVHDAYTEEALDDGTVAHRSASFDCTYVCNFGLLIIIVIHPCILHSPSLHSTHSTPVSLLTLILGSAMFFAALSSSALGSPATSSRVLRTYSHCCHRHAVGVQLLCWEEFCRQSAEIYPRATHPSKAIDVLTLSSKMGVHDRGVY